MELETTSPYSLKHRILNISDISLSEIIVVALIVSYNLHLHTSEKLLSTDLVDNLNPYYALLLQPESN